ncbi:hypothetical protein LOK49_LG08G00663 [Camellia lanceoleosa]|uniref:Uncharacterized protein n=1 Tax=Camellia lanceoleosa TaxID=1840588 RepID=A0ACC0GM77_9ERIC|nr:hypothetical protein LOK49_LG08G00663 [Camellia lanceoleosa]
MERLWVAERSEAVALRGKFEAEAMRNCRRRGRTTQVRKKMVPMRRKKKMVREGVWWCLSSIEKEEDEVMVVQESSPSLKPSSSAICHC